MVRGFVFFSMALLFVPAVQAAEPEEPTLMEALQKLPPGVAQALLMQMDLAAAERGLAVCFAPDTPASYAEEITQRFALGSEYFGGLSRYQAGNRWSNTATNGGGLGQGEPVTLTWSYIPDGTNIPSGVGEPSGPSNLFAWLNGIYSGGFNEWHALIVDVMDQWSALTGVNHVYEPNDDGATWRSSPGVLGTRGDVRIGAHRIDGNSGILAYNYFPNGGEMVLDSADNFYNSTTNNSRRFRNVVSHEHGHGVGMNHVCPINQSKLMEPFASTAFNMLQYDDILGVQSLYGDAHEQNDTSATATVLTGNSVTARNVTTDGDTDPDWWSFTATTGTTVSVTLTPDGTTYLNGPQRSNGSCTAGTNFDALRQDNLALAIIGPNGTNVLASSNNGIGQAETLNNVAVPAGTNYIRVLPGTSDNAQMYELTLTKSSGPASTGAELVTGYGPNSNSAALFTQWEHDYSTKVAECAAFGSTYGTNVGEGNIDGGSLDEVLVGPGPSPVNGPQVRAFNPATCTAKAKVNYFAYGTLRFGVKAQSGDLDSDNFDEILTAAGPGAVFGPHVRAWQFDNNALSAMGAVSFFAYGTLKFGVNVDGANVDGSGNHDIITGAGPGQVFAAQVRGFRVGGGVSAMGGLNIFAFSNTFHGARVSGADFDSDGVSEFLVGQGPNANNSTEVRGYDFSGSVSQALSVVAFPGSMGGAIVAGGDLDDAVAGDEFVVGYGGFNTTANANVRGYEYDGSGGATLIAPDFTAYSGNTFGVTLALAEIGNF